MLKTIKTSALSALIGAALVSALSAGARAEGLYFGFDSDGGSRAGIVIDDRDDDGPRRGDRWNRNGRDRWAGACTPERALDKAERLGLRRARIVDVDRRTIEVVGRRHGDRVYVTFARAPRCPVIR